MSASCETRTLTASDARRLVSLACRAPSVYNSQPWAWRIGHGGIELYADRARQLPVADPDGRNLVIGCGAALHHFQVAARASGWAPSVTRFPDPGDPDLLAEILLPPRRPRPGTPPTWRRCESRSTDRRRFTSWPVPDERLGPAGRGRHGVGRHAGAAARRHRALPRRAAGQPGPAAAGAGRLGGRGAAGTGSTAATAPACRWTRCRSGPRPSRATAVASATGPSPTPAGTSRAPTDWWSSAATPTTPPPGSGPARASAPCGCAPSSTDCPSSRSPRSSRSRRPGPPSSTTCSAGLVVPLLLVRVGWQAIGRSQLPRTPRRPVDEVLVS